MASASPSGEALSTTFSVNDVTVVITAAEMQAGGMAAAKASRVSQLFREHGVVLVTSTMPIVPFEDLDVMRERLDFQSAMALAYGVLSTGSERSDGSSKGLRVVPWK